MAEQGVSRQNPSADDKVEGAIRRIEWLHDEGKKSLDSYPDEMPPNQMRRDAEALGINHEILRKARVFAWCCGKQEVKKMTALARHENYALPFKVVIALLTVENARSRRAWAKRAIEGKWTAAKLNAELRQRRGKKWEGGRRPREAADEAEALSRLQDMSDRWQREYQVVVEAIGKGAVRDRGDEVVSAMGELLAAIGRRQRRGGG